jgi:hypothetical protein
MALSRWIYEECFGPISKGLVVRHKCDNPLCINPEHLELGTVMQNTLDKKRHNTWQSGEKHPRHILTWKDVREIRRQHIRGTGLRNRGNTAKLATKYGVSDYTIRDIVAFKSWM